MSFANQQSNERIIREYEADKHFKMPQEILDEYPHATRYLHYRRANGFPLVTVDLAMWLIDDNPADVLISLDDAAVVMWIGDSNE